MHKIAENCLKMISGKPFFVLLVYPKASKTFLISDKNPNQFIIYNQLD